MTKGQIMDVRARIGTILLACLTISCSNVYGQDAPAVRYVVDDESPSVESDVELDDDPLADLDALLDQDITSLRRTSVAPALNVEVTTVSRQRSTVGRSAAAVYVINQEMIRRSGARSVPELLRQVPGLHVARIDANKWVVSSRGFSSRFSNKLLVQIDGRTVYTPLFAGVFWDVQDLLLDDIERIEVIRGPGATVWGANAVNGVINVITKSAADTRGAYVEAGGGSEEQGFVGGRLGGRTQRGVDWRVSGKWFDRDSQAGPAAGFENDNWTQGRVGVRTDWSPDDFDHFTFQGDFYQGSNGLGGTQGFVGAYAIREPVSGGNLLWRWTRTYDETSDMSLQTYYDRTHRRTLGFEQNINIFDVDFQRRIALNRRHRLIWGLGYRRIWDNFPKSFATSSFITMTPSVKTTELFSAFIQDEMTLIPDTLIFTVGTKMSDNAFTDFEIQPTARMVYLPNDRSAWWVSVSRAVRTPSRIEHDGAVAVGPLVPPGVPAIALFGNSRVQSENLMAYEMGYRRQPADWFSWDCAFFFNKYDDIITFSPFMGFPLTGSFINRGNGESYGCEVSAQVQMIEGWRISAWYSFLKLHFSNPMTNGETPQHQAFLRSSFDVTNNLDLDVTTRYVDFVPALLTPGGTIPIPSYFAMDIRLAWRPNDQVELSVVGQNLLDSRHLEYGGNVFSGDVATQAQRGVYGMLTVGY